jgi:hypothetical protein
VATQGGAVSLPLVGGFGGSIDLPQNDAPFDTTMTLTLVDGALSGAPQPSLARTPRNTFDTSTPSVLLSLEITFTKNVQFSSFPGLTITLPATMSTDGKSFYIAAYTGTQPGSTLMTSIGPGTRNGQSVQFQTVSGAVNFSADSTYLIEFYEIGGLPSPSPSPSPSVSPSNSPTPTPSPTPTVSASPGQGGTVSLDITGSPVAMAYQAGGNGRWTPLSSGQASFSVSGTNAYAFAYTCGIDSAATGGFSVVVVQATIGEMDSILVPCAQPQTGTLSGSIAYASGSFCPNGSGDSAQYTYVGVQTVSPGCPGGSYSVSLEAGTQDVVAAAEDANFKTLAVRTIQGVQVPGTGVGIDFTSGDALGAPQMVTQSGLPNTAVSETTDMLFGTFENWAIPLGAALAGTQSYSYGPVASQDIGPTDSYLADGTAYLDGPGSAALVETQTFGQSPPSSIPFSAPFNASVNPGAAPTFALDYRGFAGLSGGISGYEVEGAWQGTNAGNFASLVSSGFLQATGLAAYPAPSVPVNGFPSMVAAAKVSYSWKVTAIYAPQALFVGVPMVQAVPQVTGSDTRVEPVVHSWFTILAQAAPPVTGSVYYSEASGAFTVP